MAIGSRKLWRRWVIAFTLGELFGFGGISVIDAFIALGVTAGLDVVDRSLILYGIAVVGGLGEGAILAWFQSRVLSVYLSRFRPCRWIGVTAATCSVGFWECRGLLLCPLLCPTMRRSRGGPHLPFQAVR